MTLTLLSGRRGGWRWWKRLSRDETDGGSFRLLHGARNRPPLVASMEGRQRRGDRLESAQRLAKQGEVLAESSKLPVCEVRRRPGLKRSARALRLC